jgi:two-component system chemotaxis response regulator CheY
VAATRVRAPRAGRSVFENAVCDDHEMARPRLLIVDDHEDFRSSARTLLELEGFDVVGVAADGPSALSAVQALAPDVVLLDVQLPGMDGFEVVRQLQAREHGARVVLISSRDRSAYAAELREARVAGFLGKSELSGAALHALVA